MRRATILLALLGACSEQPQAEIVGPPSLEQAAIERGLVLDPASAALPGLYARENDRLCVAGDDRIGMFVDYGPDHRCAARGTVEQDGATLRIRIAQDCAFEASYDGMRIVLPGVLPVGCRTACTGRASLAGLAVDRLSGSASEALALRTPGGTLLCAGAG